MNTQQRIAMEWRIRDGDYCEITQQMIQTETTDTNKLGMFPVMFKRLTDRERLIEEYEDTHVSREDLYGAEDYAEDLERDIAKLDERAEIVMQQIEDIMKLTSEEPGFYSKADLLDRMREFSVTLSGTEK